MSALVTQRRNDQFGTAGKRSSDGEAANRYYHLATAGWERKWPVEEIWVAHLAQ